jgi:type II secretory pathway component GspD/PulD (secretin)
MPARTHVLAALAAGLLALAVAPARAGDGKAKMLTQTYQVADLVVPIADKVGEPNQPAPATAEDKLIKLLVETVAPASWAEHGGPGTIDYFPLTMSLVINQSAAVHEQIADLLAALRRMQDLEVALEVRFVTVAEDCLERLGVAREDKDGVTFLNDKQLALLMESVQGDRRTSIMQAPKVTLFNGQAGTVNATDTQHYLTGLDVTTVDGKVVLHPKNEPATTGFRMTARPVVSADRRFVQVGLKVEQTDLATEAVPLVPVTVSLEYGKGKPVPCTQYLQQPKFNKLAIKTTVAIPDGGTALIGGMKKLVETRNEFGPPVLSKVPYVNRLFKNVAYGQETQQVYVLVTPRVIVNEQEEVQALRSCPSCIVPVPWPSCRCYVVPVENPGQESGLVQAGKLSSPGCVVTAERIFTAEEQEPREKSEKPCRQEKILAKLLKAYHQACAEGQADEAEKYARAALALDPMCFGKKAR